MSLALALQAFALYAFALVLSATGGASGRRAALITACIAITLLPLLSLAPHGPISAASSASVLDAIGAIEEPAADGTRSLAAVVPLRLPPSAILSWVWATGAAFAAARLATDLYAVRRLRASAFERKGDMAFSDQIEIPVVIGIFRPLVLLPVAAKHWSAERLSLVLAHERAHAHGHDNFWLLLARSIACIHWFDPLAWLSVAVLRDVCEHNADDKALDDGADQTEYARTLVDLARHRPPAALAMARQSGLERRVRAVLGERHRSGHAALALRAGLVVALAIGTTAAAPPPRIEPLSTPPHLGALLEAEAERLVAAYHPEGVALIVMSVRSGEIIGQAERGGLLERPVPPGSVLKPFVAVAALEAGLQVDHAFADGNMASILERSSNPGAIEMATMAGRPALRSVFERVELTVPDALSLEQIALGGALVTPVQIASAWTHLAGHKAIAAPIAAKTRELLVGAVEGEHATGRRAAVPGMRIAGKTGTSPLVRADGAVEKDLYLASFVGLVPADDPEIVVLVSVAGAHGDEVWGGTVAAPAFRRIVEGM